jgi:GH15 family glucan-1,4-alpha-glucosidase
VVRVTDCMPPRDERTGVVRVVEALRGSVAMRMELVIRLDYGATVPWVQKADGGIVALAGPDALRLHSPVETRGQGLTTVAEFTVTHGEKVPFVLTWHPSHEAVSEPIEPFSAVDHADRWWRRWSSRCTYAGVARDEVLRSLIVLKALTYEPTGGIVAAPTTSLPEALGGVRNWDYRYCWLRDAALTLEALVIGGYVDEALAFRAWVMRATRPRASSNSTCTGSWPTSATPSAPCTTCSIRAPGAVTERS